MPGGEFLYSPFDLGGRLSRGRYVVLSTASFFCFVAMVVIVFMAQPAASDLLSGSLFAAFVSLMLLNVFATIRRLHDLGRSGWWAGIFFVPFPVMFGPLLVLEDPGRIYLHDAYLPTLAVLILVCGFFGMRPNMDTVYKRGESGPNRYGPDPLARKSGGE